MMREGPRNERLKEKESKPREKMRWKKLKEAQPSHTAGVPFLRA
jgi:hypothetical protein